MRSPKAEKLHAFGNWKLHTSRAGPRVAAPADWFVRAAPAAIAAMVSRPPGCCRRPLRSAAWSVPLAERDRGNSGRFIPACVGNSRSAARLGCSSPVHPRVCGELVPLNPLRSATSRTPISMSPGMLCCAHVVVCRHRLLLRRCRVLLRARLRVALRGRRERLTDSRRRFRLGVHPRVCGELPTPPGEQTGTAGSSPRVRGTPRHRRTPPSCWRFIPACAGNSRKMSCARCSWSVHPRVCGELGLRRRRRCTQERFIPACAGNSATWQPPTPAPAVHPRVCGELCRRVLRPTRRRGSSPRVRGTRQRPQPVRHAHRFIPACAGNSCSPRRSPGRGAVHPRVCGELRRKQPAVDVFVGSSPRVRGTPCTPPSRPVPRRFIPACAGNSPATESGALSTRVHPRVCGELAWLPSWTLAQTGSSPRVRGTLAALFLG